MQLLTENSILKKGILIQNKKFKDTMNQLQDFNMLLKDNQRQKQEIDLVRAQNVRLQLELQQQQQRNRYSQGCNAWDEEKPNSHFGGGDPYG